MFTGCLTRVLIVDEYVDAANSLAVLIELWGYDVKVSHDGASALQCWADYRPHVALLEIGLGPMSGFEIARQIVQRTDLPLPVLIAVSGYAGHGYRARAAALGFNDYFVKPADLFRLRALLSGVKCGNNCLLTATACGPDLGASERSYRRSARRGGRSHWEGA